MNDKSVSKLESELFTCNLNHEREVAMRLAYEKKLNMFMSTYRELESRFVVCAKEMYIQSESLRKTYKTCNELKNENVIINENVMVFKVANAQLQEIKNNLTQLNENKDSFIEQIKSQLNTASNDLLRIKESHNDLLFENKRMASELSVQKDNQNT